MKKISLLLIVSLFIFSACNNKTKEKKDESKTSSKKEILNKIKKTEKEVFDVPPEKINPSKANILAEYYIEYAAFGDSLAPEYLYKATGILMNTGNPRKAVKAINEILEKYPEFDKTENCYFLRAFVYDDKIKDTSRAGQYYREYLKRYPDGDFAPDAKLLLKNMGKSTEEIFKELEKK